MISKKRFIVIGTIFFLVSSILYAQISSQETGSIRGVVKDNEGVPLPGVSITVKGPSLMGQATDVSREDGTFRILLLPPGQYAVTAELPGFKTATLENVEVRLGMAISVSITMIPETLAEEITVVGEAPVIDVKSSKTQQIYKSDLIQNIPIGRSLQSVITLTPGTVSSSNVKGGTAANNTYRIDGLNANDPCQQQLDIPIDFNLFEEVEIVTGGMPAEVGGTSGAYVNVVTKSGGNEFSGMVQSYFINEDLTTVVLPQEELTALGLSKPSAPIYDYDFSGNFGGPIIKDKIWFYLNGRYGADKYNTGFIPFTSPYDGTYYDTFHRKSHNWGTFMKLTFQLSKSVKLALMGNARQTYRNTRASGWNMPFDCHYHDDPWANYAATGVLTWLIDSNTYLEVRGGYTKVDSMLTLVRPELTTVPYMYDYYTGYYFGTGYRPNEWTGRPKKQFSIALTRFLDNLMGGDHEIKAGLELLFGGDNWAVWKENPIWWPWYNGSPYYYRALYGTRWWGDAWLGMAVFGTTKEGNIAQGEFIKYGGYIQDSITFKNRLTVNLGIRLDHVTGNIPEVYKNRTGGDIAYQLGEVFLKPTYGINPYDEIRQEGVDGIIKWLTWDPRIGITYDVFGNGKTAIKLHWGKYSDNIYVSIFERVHPLRFHYYYFSWWDDNANGRPDPLGVDSYSFIPSWGTPTGMLRENWLIGIGEGIKAPYDNQFVVGIDQELVRDFKIGLSFLYKHKKNIIDDVPYDVETGEYWYNPNESPGNKYWIPFKTTVPAVGKDFPATTVNMWFLSNDAPRNWIYQVQNVPEAFRKYWAFELSFEKRMSNGWQLGGSINYSKTWGNIHGGYGDIHATSSAADDANWFVNNGGRTNEDRPIVFKLFGSFDLPLGILGSFYYQYSSGTPWARGVTIVPPAGWAAVNNIDVYSTYWVNLELQGTRRYYDWQNLDLRLEKYFIIPNLGRLGVYVDIFNALGHHYIDVDQNPGGTWMPVDNNTSEGTYAISGTYKRITGISGLTRRFQLSVRFSF